MRKLIAAIMLSLLAACVSQPPYRYAEGTGVYVAPVPAYYDWPLVYRNRTFPGWYGAYPYYTYWGFPSPWGFYYYSPNFYPYHFSVAYSLWPDFYGGRYDPWIPWRPPYRGNWHPHPTDVPGVHGVRGASLTRAPGRPTYGSPTAKSKAGGLEALYGKGVVDSGRGVYGSYPGKQGSAYPAPSKTGPAFAPPPALTAPRTAAPAGPAARPMSPARARNPAGRPANPAKPDWQKH